MWLLPERREPVNILTYDLLSRTQTLCLHSELFLKILYFFQGISQQLVNIGLENPVDMFCWVFQKYFEEVLIKCFKENKVPWHKRKDSSMSK